MKRTPISVKVHRLAIENPGVSVPDGHGGYTTSWSRLPQTFWGSLEPASAHDLERVVAHTEQASTVMAIRGLDYHPDISIDSRVVYQTSRVLQVLGLEDIDEKHIELVLIVQEVLSRKTPAASARHA